MHVRLGTLLALLLASVAAFADAAEDRAAEMVENLGGSVTREEMTPGKPIIRVNLYGCDTSDADLRVLAALTKLQTLDLTFGKVTDAGLKELASFKNLRVLDLDYNKKVTDAGLKDLAALKGLQMLRLGFTEVTEEGVKELQKALPGCRIRH